MDSKEEIIRKGVTNLKIYHSRTVNTSHPMVYGSVFGIFIVSLILGTLLFFNNNPDIIGMSLSHSEELKFNFQSSTMIPLAIIFFFLFCSFKLALQGVHLSFVKALLMFFRVAQYDTKKLWHQFWIVENNGQEFTDNLKKSTLRLCNFNTQQAKDSFLLFTTADYKILTEENFETLINNIFNDHCLDNRLNSDLKNKSAVFADSTSSSHLNASRFNKFILNAKSVYQISIHTPFIEQSATIIKMINAIPYVILLFYIYFTITCLVTFQTPMFFEQQQSLILTLDISIFFGILYSLIAFWFLRRTEDWRQFWQNDGLDFLILYHSLGENKIPPFILPDTTFYEPSDYYKVIEATKELTLESLYKDKRNMFFDNSQYQFLKIFSIINRSYIIDSGNSSVVLKNNEGKNKHLHHNNF